MVEFWAKLVETSLLLLIGKRGVASVVLKNTKCSVGPGFWVMIAAVWCLVVYVGVIVAAPWSDLHLNPAAPSVLMPDRTISLVNVINYAIARLCGTAPGIVLDYLYCKPNYDLTTVTEAMKDTFCGSSLICGNCNKLLGKAVGAFVLMFVFFYTSGGRTIVNNRMTLVELSIVGASPVVLLFGVIGLECTIGYFINLARDLAPRIINHILTIKYKMNSGWDYAWILVCGPLYRRALAFYPKELLLLSA